MFDGIMDSSAVVSILVAMLNRPRPKRGNPWSMGFMCRIGGYVLAAKAMKTRRSQLTARHPQLTQ
ncbi:MAG: hypothetical protein OHK0012_16240 [Synechococcales cyanobacterium]